MSGPSVRYLIPRDQVVTKLSNNAMGRIVMDGKPHRLILIDRAIDVVNSIPTATATMQRDDLAEDARRVVRFLEGVDTGFSVRFLEYLRANLAAHDAGQQ